MLLQVDQRDIVPVPQILRLVLLPLLKNPHRLLILPRLKQQLPLLQEIILRRRELTLRP